MAPKLRMASTFCSIILLFIFSSAVGDDEWISECKNAKYNEQKECLIFGSTYSRITVNKSNIHGAERLFVFCHQGWSNEWYRLWINSKIKVIPSEVNQDLQFIFGSNFSDVKSNYESSLASIWNLFPVQLKEEFAFKPFNVSCWGIASKQNYVVEFKVRNPDLWFVAYIATGIIIFFSAKSWSKNIALHYTTGISVGILASLLIVIFILTKFMPQKLKNLGYLILFFGGSTSLYMMNTVALHFNEIMQQKWQYVLGYIAVTGLLSFAAVYKFGPVTDTKTLNLVQWTLQLLGLVFIFIGSQIPEAAIAIIIVMFSVYNFPRRVISGLKSFKFKFFRPKVRLLTEDEYMIEGQEETRKALDELRSFCHSPDCDSWRVISRLKHPNRFARFVEGESHIEDTELLEHDSLNEFDLPSDLSDNESEIDFRLSTP